jgi:Xaa-Pro aminopeptidase
LYDIVLAAQHAAFDKCELGCSWNEPHEAAVNTIAQGLLDEKILSGSLQQVLESKSYAQFYMHRTGHWLGMDVHDVGDYHVDESWRELEAGMVFTVEPGVYVNPSAEVDVRWHNIGIRIEDNVLIRKQGMENFSADVPTDPDQIEALMAAA